MFNHIYLTKVPLSGVLWAPGRGWKDISSHQNNSRGRCSESHCAGLSEKGLIFISHRKDPSSAASEAWQGSLLTLAFRIQLKYLSIIAFTWSGLPRVLFLSYKSHRSE